MCGIAGIFRFDQQPVGPKALCAMTGLLSHRGPDDAAHFLLNTKTGEHTLDGQETGPGPEGADLALGHRRLSIIDLSPAGRQPMCNEDGSLWLVVNGEFYNFLELREELEQRGHRFSSMSDSEVALHLYEEMGPDFIQRIEGMFALALFDARKRRLVLARDRVGKKPLWYSLDGKRLAFASELKALWGAGLIPREVDPKALDMYLAYGYVPAPHGIFKGAKKLLPGELAVVRADGGMQKRRYWRLSFAHKMELSPERAATRVRDALERAVAKRLISDVPLGAFLSGGLDSSLVTALMCRISPERVKTFAVGFGEKGFDETAQARRVARHLGTEHTEIMVRPHLAETLPTLAWYYGEPFADSSALPTYLLSRVTRKHVTVALNGDGGDESFFGYRRYRGLNLAQNLSRLPKPALRAGSLAFGLLSDLKGRDRSSFEYGRRLFSGLAGGGSLLEAYLDWHGLFSAPQRRDLLTPEFLELLDAPEDGGYLAEALRACDANDAVERFVAADAATYLPEDLLVKVDIASMANALECRSPLLDREVMELAASLKPEAKLHGSRTKAVLKDAAGELLPREIIERPKMGFGLPVGRWFKGELQGWLRDLVLEGPLVKAGWLQKSAMENLIDAHTRGKADHTGRLWSLAFLAQWMDTVWQGPAEAPEPPRLD